MNALEAEYSFLAPTWKLPMVSTTSMYSRPYGPSYLSSSLDSGPDWTLLQNTAYNSRYIPSTTIPRNYPIPMNYQRTVPPTISLQQQNYQTTGGRSTQSIPHYYQQSNNINPDDGLNSATNVHPNYEYESQTNSYNYGQSNHPKVNRGLTYATNNQTHSQAPPPSQKPYATNNQTYSQAPLSSQKRRVQIIDHNRHTPSTVTNGYTSDRNSRNSNQAHLYSHQNHTPDVNRSHHNRTPQDQYRPQPKSRQSVTHQHRDHNDENRFGYSGNNTNIHEYLYGTTESDGGYTNAFKQHQRRLQDEKLGRKSVMSEYKSFAQNGGFGPSFGNNERLTYGDKINIDKKKKNFSKTVRQTNQQRIEEQKRLHSNNGQQKTRAAPIPKYQRAREYADTIEKPQHTRPVSQVESSSQIANVAPIIITSLSNTSRRTSFENTQSHNLINFLSHKFNINRTERSSSSSSITRRRQHVRFQNRNFKRPHSSTVIDLPSHIIGTGIPSRKESLSTSKNLEEKIPRQIKNIEHLKNSSNRSLQSASYKNEKKFIISHSMIMTKNMRLPPTASVLINQAYIPSFMTTLSTKKTDSNKDVIPSQRPFTAHSIPCPLRKTTSKSKLNLDLQIKPVHSNSSDE